LTRYADYAISVNNERCRRRIDRLTQHKAAPKGIEFIDPLPRDGASNVSTTIVIRCPNKGKEAFEKRPRI
jgi:hypothetical protein